MPETKQINYYIENTEEIQTLITELKNKLEFISCLQARPVDVENETFQNIINNLLKEKNTLRALLNKYQSKLELLNKKIEFDKTIDNHVTNAKTLKVKSDKKVKTK